MSARLLMIALDGADGYRLERGSADGSLPHLAALRSRGETQRLSAPPGATDDAIWASFQYSAELGEHGRYHLKLPLRDGRLGMAHQEELDRDTFWDRLSERGQRMAILDVPKCRAPRPINGIHLVDWLVHGRYFDKPQSQPPALAAEVLQRFGPAPASRCACAQPALTDDDIGDITRNLRAAVTQKRAAGLHYLGAEPWDLVIIGFKEAHCGSHTFWDLSDASHPAHDPARRARLGDPVTTILRDIDSAVGDLVAAAGPAAEVVAFSTTHFEPNGCLDHLMPAIIERLNGKLSASRGRRPARPLDRWFTRARPSPPDWPCAILPYNENCAALRVARANEMAAAPPDPAMLHAIETELRALCDAETGLPAVAAVTRPSTELPGARAASLPDLLIHSASGAFPRAIVSPGLGRIECASPSMRPGNHIAGGFVIAAGKAAAAASAGLRTMAGFGALAEKVLAQRV